MADRCQLSPSHVPDDRLTELGALHQGCAFHQAVEVVGHRLGADGAFHAFDDQVSRFVPAEVAEHHFAGENHRAWVHLVEVGVLRRRAVRGFEDGVASDVVDVAAGRDADAPDQIGRASCRERV